MTALYVSDRPSSMQFSDVANIYGLGAPTQPPLKFGLFFFDYDLDGRPDLLSANGHLEPDISKVQASESYEQPIQLFWNTGKPGRSLYTQIGAKVAGPDLFKPIVGRGERLCRHRRRRRPRRGGDHQQRPRPPLPQRRRQRKPLDPHPALRRRQVDQPRGDRRQGRAPRSARMICRRQLFPSKSYLSSVELPMTFGLGKAEKIDALTITWPSGQDGEIRGARGR